MDTKGIIGAIVMDVISAMKKDPVLNQKQWLPRESLITPETNLPVHVLQRGKRKESSSDCDAEVKYYVPLRISSVVTPSKVMDIRKDPLYDFEARVNDAMWNSFNDGTLSPYITELEFVGSDERVIFDTRNPKLLKIFANSMVTEYNAYYEVDK